MKLLLWALTSWGAIILNQSVGVVADSIVTSREVQVAMVIESLLEASDAKSMSFKEIQVKDTKFADMVSTYLLEKAAVEEAIAFSVGDVDEKSLKEFLGRLEKATAGKAYWQNLDVEPAFLKKVLTTKLIARNFIKIKTESMSSVITDNEAQSYFEKNRLKFGSSPFETFKENIKTFLAKQQRDERLRSWFEVLKKKYKVRNILIENAKTPEDTARS